MESTEVGLEVIYSNEVFKIVVDGDCFRNIIGSIFFILST